MFAFSVSSISRIVALIAFSVLISVNVLATNDDRIVNTTLARQNGLELQWFSQVRVTPSIGTVKEMVMTVDENLSTTYFELNYGDNREVFGEYDIDISGKVNGIEGAEEWAKLRKEVLKASNIDATITKFVRPKTTLYVLTTGGVVQSFDAESGKTNWTVSVGKFHHPAVGISANAGFVAVVSGPSIYCLEADTGLERWSQKCSSGPTGGVAISDSYIFVTQASGLVEIFPFAYEGLPPQRFISFGNVTVKPHVTDLSISWPSGRGYYNVASANEPDSIAYRLKADSNIVAAGTSTQNRIIVASLDGKAYSLDERSGRMQWEFSAGNPLSQSPVAFGNSVFVMTDIDRLYKLNASTGSLDENWPRGINGISRFVAASQKNAYFISDKNNLVGLDRKSGTRTCEISIGTNDLFFTNTLSDRIYFCSQTGTIQCLRELSNTQPYFHADAEEDESAGKDKAAMGKPVNPFGDTEDDAGMAEGANPFGDDATANPFGGDDAKDAADDANDPFGGGGNDSKDDEDDDPFGGG